MSLFNNLGTTFRSNYTGFLNPSLYGTVGNIGGTVRNSALGLSNGNSWSWFGPNGIAPIAIAGLQTLGGLGDLWLGSQNLQLAQKAYGAQIDAMNQNGRLQAQLINNKLKNAGYTNAQLSGYNYDKALAAVNDEIDKRKVEWNNIG